MPHQANTVVKAAAIIRFEGEWVLVLLEHPINISFSQGVDLSHDAIEVTVEMEGYGRVVHGINPSDYGLAVKPEELPPGREIKRLPRSTRNL